MTVQELIGRFAYDLRYTSLPEEVVLRAKYCLLDYLGVALAGSTSSLACRYYSLMKEIGGIKESIMIGDGGLVPAMWAATTNGAIGHVHELDDGDRFALGHPGVTSVPSAIAVGEREESSGKEIITAIVLGYEVFSRIARAVNPSHRARGFHTTSTCGTFGAAIASGKLMGLDSDQLSSALGIAGIQAAGIAHGGEKSLLKPLQVGKTCGNGVLAAMLAQMDIPTSTTIIDGERGFALAVSDNVDLDIITKDLGRHFKILDSYVKFHAACRHTHPSIDAVLDLRRRYDLRPNDVKRIVVRTYAAAAKLGTGPSRYRPLSPHAAKFSIPYVVAVAITEGKADIDSFSSKKIKDTTILGLSDKVKVEEDEKMTTKVPNKRGSTVEVETNDGHVLSSTFENPIGEPENLDFKKVEEKFYSLSIKRISEEKAKELYTMVMNLERVEDISILRGLLF